MPGGHSVWAKVGLYFFDIGSDWINGGLMLRCPDNSTNATLATPLNEDSDCEPWWGSLTIAMSWMPPTIVLPFLVIYIVKEYIYYVVRQFQKLTKSSERQNSCRGVNGRKTCTNVFYILAKSLGIFLIVWLFGGIAFVLWPVLVPIVM